VFGRATVRLGIGPHSSFHLYWCGSHATKPSVHRLNDHYLQTSDSSKMVVDLSSSAAPYAPLLPPTLGSTSGQQTLRVHDTAINYSLPRTTSGADHLPKTGSGIPTSKRRRPEVDDDTGGHYEPRDPVSTSM